MKNKYNLQLQYNTGENITFEKACKQKGLGADFEYIAPGWSQQNGCIERKFATLFNWVCGVLNGGKLNAYLQNGLWAKAANTATSLMQKFDEMCITTYRDNMHWAKLANFGTPDTWVGCAEVNFTGTYWFFNPKIKKIILT